MNHRSLESLCSLFFLIIFIEIKSIHIPLYSEEPASLTKLSSSLKYDRVTHQRLYNLLTEIALSFMAHIISHSAVIWFKKYLNDLIFYCGQQFSFPNNPSTQPALISNLMSTAIADVIMDETRLAWF